LGEGSAVTLEENVRRVWPGICLAVIAVVVSGCGSGEEPLDEYVEELNAVVNQAGAEYEAIVASPQGEVFVAEGAQLSEFTPQDLQVALERVAAIQVEALAAIEAIEPPEQVVELHHLFFRELPFDALAVRAGSAADWEELSASPEMAAYRAALVSDIQVCDDFKAELDGGGGFAIDAWLSADLKEVGEALLGCEAYPANPEDVYRPPAASTP
jgi:hypothetical protein